MNGGATTSPRERVEAFLADFLRAHASVRPKGDEPLDFGRWAAALAEVDGRHFAPGRSCGEASSFSDKPDLAAGRVSEVTEDGDRARVEVVATSFLTRYFEYDLVRRDGDWRIVQALSFLDPAGKPFLEGGSTVRRDAPLTPVDDEDQVRAPALFEVGRVLTLRDRSSPIEVRPVGEIRLESGVLAVFDLGYDATDAVPLTRTVPPGSYPVEVSVAFDRVAATRIRFGPGPVVAWRNADRGDRGHIVGVDAGNVAIVDLGSLERCEARHKEREFHRALLEPDARPVAALVSLGGPQDGVVTESGWGDGGYPVFWGLDDAGEPAVLLVDFRLAPV